MLDSLGGGLGSPLFFDSGLSGLLPRRAPSPSNAQSPTSTTDSPSWLFTSQSVYGAQSTASNTGGGGGGELSSLLSSLERPRRPSSTLPDSLRSFDVSQLAGVPLKQMSGRYGSRRGYGVAPASFHQQQQASPGAPGSPLVHSPQSQSSPSTVTPKNPKLYKTELCRSWMDHGRCNYGERCQYAHGEHEKRPIPRHPKYKTEACQSYHQTGYCPYGARCHFIHNESELLSRRAPSAFSGSTGESPAPSSAESAGSESPKGSFSPSLEADERRQLPLARCRPSLSLTLQIPLAKSNIRDGSRSPDAHPHHLLLLLSSHVSAPLSSKECRVSNETRTTPVSDSMSGLLGQVLNWSLDEQVFPRVERPTSLRPSSEDPQTRLPVFAQLSNASV